MYVICSTCKRPVFVETCKFDELGKPLHEGCAVSGLRLNASRAYSLDENLSRQQRVVKLRDEIAQLRYENTLYRSQVQHTHEQEMADDSRRTRLLEIREELRTLLRAESATPSEVKKGFPNRLNA